MVKDAAFPLLHTASVLAIPAVHEITSRITLAFCPVVLFPGNKKAAAPLKKPEMIDARRIKSAVIF